MRSRNLVLVLAALVMVVTLAACTSSGQSSGDKGPADRGKEPKAQKQKPTKQIAPKKGKEEQALGGKNRVEPPKKKRLKLTVPAMKEIKDDPIPTGHGTDAKLFHDYAGVHLNSSGFPWKQTANVYIAGHRIGFPGTRSNLAFYDLEDLKNGDKVYLEDADGRKYTYVVYRKLIVDPTNLSVIKPIKGKNIVSLQTCTLPDYTKRVIYQAELKDITTQDDQSENTQKDTKSKDAQS